MRRTFVWWGLVLIPLVSYFNPPIPTVDLNIPLTQEIFDEAEGHFLGLGIFPTICGVRLGVYRVF